MARKSPRCPTCAARGSSHERYARDLEERTHDIAITGRVLKSDEPYLIDQQSACEWFKVSDQTLRSYACLGMPVHGPHQRPLYQVGEVSEWIGYYRNRATREQKQHGLSYHIAELCYLSIEAQQSPDSYVLVPLDWDHPPARATRAGRRSTA